MKYTHQHDHEIMRILNEDTMRNVSLISRIICETNMGVLKLNLRKGETKYYFTLDAVELLPETNKELMEFLFPKIIEEKIDIKKLTNDIFEKYKKSFTDLAKIDKGEQPNIIDNGGELVLAQPIKPIKKAGRPKKNK